MNLANVTCTPSPREELAQHLDTIHDFPKPGIAFKDISPLLASPEAFNELLEYMAHDLKQAGTEVIVALDARGFLLGAPLARELGVPLVMARKPGKLPGECASVQYDLEYGSAELEIRNGIIPAGKKVAVVDDLLATGGTANAACSLIEQAGAEVCGCFFAIELEALPGKSVLGDNYGASVMHL